MACSFKGVLAATSCPQQGLWARYWQFEVLTLSGQRLSADICDWLQL